eukprot:5429478-Prymnesium_polylepis.1
MSGAHAASTPRAQSTARRTAARPAAVFALCSRRCPFSVHAGHAATRLTGHSARWTRASQKI